MWLGRIRRALGVALVGVSLVATQADAVFVAIRVDEGILLIANWEGNAATLMARGQRIGHTDGEHSLYVVDDRALRLEDVSIQEVCGGGACPDSSESALLERSYNGTRTTSNDYTVSTRCASTTGRCAAWAARTG